MPTVRPWPEAYVDARQPDKPVRLLGVGTRVLLDTNVWIDIANQDAALDLRRVARAHELEILVSPAVVFELLRNPNEKARRRQLAVATRRWWTRLMPEAYVECEELVNAIRGRRQGWIIEPPLSDALANFHANRAHWRHGFWETARRRPALQAELNEQLGSHTIELSRRDVEARRAASRVAKRTIATLQAEKWHETTCEVKLGRARIRTEWWRAGAANYFVSQLIGRGGSRETYHDWLDPWLDYRHLLDQESWLRFWLEVDPAEVPTQWLRWAAEVLAPLQKVNQGTVFDEQLTAYLHAADVFVTADTRFHLVAEAIAQAAPFPVALPVRTTETSWPDSLASLATNRRGG